MKYFVIFIVNSKNNYLLQKFMQFKLCNLHLKKLLTKYCISVMFSNNFFFHIPFWYTEKHPSFPFYNEPISVNTYRWRQITYF